MRSKFLLLTVAVIVTAGTSFAESKKGTPEVKSISALAFGPHGVLFIGDPQSGVIFAVETGDTKPSGKTDVNVEKLGDAVGSALGTTADNVAITDVKVNPASGNIFLSVTRGKGKEAMPVVVKLNRDGKLSEFALKDVMHASVKLPNPNTTDRGRPEAITSLAFVDGKVIVAGLSSEEFASTLRAIAYPFQAADKGTSVEVFHGAHGKLETNAPVRTFVPYKIGGADYLLAAYTCTPLVKFPVSDLKPGTKVKGTTIAELGNQNRPLDMIVYNKGGKDYVLMANSARGVMKISTDTFADAQPITTPVRSGTAGVKYETIEELKGVMQLDKLDNERALVLIKGDDKALTLKSIPMP